MPESAFSGNIIPSETPLPKSGSVQVEKDRIGYASWEKAQTSIQVMPGDTVRFRAMVSTEGGIATRLNVAPSNGDGPIWPKKKTTRWVRGTDIPLSVEYVVPDGMKYMKFGIDQPNDVFAKSAQTGTIRWKQAEIAHNEPFKSSFPTGQALVYGSFAVGAGLLVWTFA